MQRVKSIVIRRKKERAGGETTATKRGGVRSNSGELQPIYLGKKDPKEGTAVFLADLPSFEKESEDSAGEEA